MGSKPSQNENKPKLGKPRQYVKPEGTVFVFEGKKYVIESRPGKRRKNEPPIASVEVLRTVIAIAEGTMFDAEAAALFDHKTTVVGRGEKSIRSHLKLTLDAPGSAGSLDIPEHLMEVKEWIKSFILRPGDDAKEKWNYHSFGMGEYIYLMEVPIIFNDVLTTYRRQWSKRVSRPFMEILPQEVSEPTRQVLLPSNMLDKYPNLALVWASGYFRIPLSDYDDAFTLNCVSQQLPRYELSRKYIERRALMALQAYTEKLGEKKVKKTAIVVGGFKPFHRGHSTLLDIAARENDEVRLYVSLSDRDRPGEVPIKGATMERIWNEEYAKTLPPNVVVEYTKPPTSPVRKAYEYLGKENEAGSDDIYRIYGTNADLNDAFPEGSLEKYADGLWQRRKIELMPISRGETVAVSGTEMRNWLHTGDEQSFIENSPSGIDAKKVWEALRADGTELTPMPVSRRRKVK